MFLHRQKYKYFNSGKSEYRTSGTFRICRISVEKIAAIDAENFRTDTQCEKINRSSCGGHSAQENA